ncbi:hypothetical protein CEXT_573931 [Caerostris extrusa]|uniref:Uncharacterized protein n=1 Tax=Caerostris extrusa TaxID=172846 RepID=A0AAV4TAJ8_CAEEX|nr:hypothetical protein CEXT_573931 [Caerostris extrusa]
MQIDRRHALRSLLLKTGRIDAVVPSVWLTTKPNLSKKLKQLVRNNSFGIMRELEPGLRQNLLYENYMCIIWMHALAPSLLDLNKKVFRPTDL